MGADPVSAPEQPYPTVSIPTCGCRACEEGLPICWCEACHAPSDGEDHRCEHCRYEQHGDWNSPLIVTYALVNPSTDEHFWLDGTRHVPYTTENRQLRNRKAGL
jgi:hypothetical protein